MEDELIIDKDIKSKYLELGMNLNSIHFKNQYLAGNLSLENISDQYIQDIQKYYKQFTDRKINLKNHIVFKNLTGKEDVRILPREVLRQDLIPFFNDKGMINTYTDKNFYDILFHEFNQPNSILKNVRGNFFTNKNVQISFEKAKDILMTYQSEYIIKSSDIENGRSINKINIINDKLMMNNIEYSFEDLISKYNSNFVIQTVIKQHETMAKLHPYSVNTLRIVTLRWNTEILHVYTFCRFGVDKDIKDNAGQGGIVVGIENNGEFMSQGANRYGKFDKHPTTNISISELNTVPNYSKCIELVKEMHKKILHQNFVSWDIAIEENGEPIFLEANFFGSAIVNQIALERPLFGDLTDDILYKAYNSLPLISKYNTVTEYSEVLNKYNDTNNKLKEARIRNNKLKTRNDKLKIKNDKLDAKYSQTKSKLNKQVINHNKMTKKHIKDIEDLKQQISSLEDEIVNIKNSRSWRYTSFLRKK